MNLPKVCYITSKEPYLVREKINEMKKFFIEKYMEINFKKIKPEQLYEEIETYPFFAEKKMLLLEDIKENEDTAELLKKVPDFCCIVIIGNLDKRKKVYKTIKKVGEIYELKPYNEKQIINWIVKIGKEMGAEIPKSAAQKIVEICGVEDMYKIHSEIIKVVSMKEKVTVDLVEKVVQKTPEYNAFALINSISCKDKKKAYEIIKVLAEQNEYLPMVLSLINRNFAVLRMMKTMEESDIEKAGIHPYTIKLLKPHCSKYTVEELDRLLDICQKLDYEMKNGMNHRIALEKLIGGI